MVNYWIKALKEFNKDNKEEWCIPKKGSNDYKKVQEMAESYKRGEERKTKIEKGKKILNNYRKKKSL